MNVITVAITKTFPFDAVRSAYNMGYRHIGENRVEEAKEKILQAHKERLNDIVWHMVGHVQGRKIPDVVRLFDWVDSVDSVELAKKLDSEAERQNKTLQVLFEVNLTGEKTKYGFEMQGFVKNVSECMELKNIVIRGLMTMPPYVTNAEDNRTVFQAMKQLSEAIHAQIPKFGTELSMGTSCDYTVAIEEGATMVRLGEALFGKRTNIAKIRA